MEKIKKIFLVGFMVLFLGIVLGACDSSHNHDYGETYYKDTTSHWKECSCGEKGNLGEHNYGEWITITEATFNSTGSKKQICATCNYENVVEIPKLEHEHNCTSEVVAPTCNTDGYTIHTCIYCGDTYKTDEVKALGHKEVIDEAVKATCTKTGLTEGAHCSVCNEILIEQEIVTLTHIYEFGICKYCDEDEHGNILRYELDDNNVDGYESYSVVGVEVLKSDLLVIPSQYKGLPVTSVAENAFRVCLDLKNIMFEGNSQLTSIGEHAFDNCSSLETITIPSSVTNIGSCAFQNCISLDSVIFEGNSQLTSIEEGAFWHCSSLTSILIPSSVTSIAGPILYGCSSLTNIIVDENGVYDSRDNCNALIETSTNTLLSGCKTTIIPSSVTSIGEYAFSGCVDLTSIIFEGNSQLRSIGDNAFSGCDGLKSIEIPNSVTTIDKEAFSYCSSLETVTIPKSVTSLGRSVFSYCNKLTKIIFEENSQLRSIGPNAFTFCKSLKSIEIPTSVTTIDNYAFSYCSNLETITIPKSLKKIAENAFSNCKKLTSVFYVGLSTDWDSISIGNGNKPLTSATKYYYSETEPVEEGNYWHYDTDGATPVVWQ